MSGALRWIIWPGFVAASIAASSVAGALGFGEYAQLAIPAALMACVVALELRMPHHGSGRHATMKGDVGHIVVGFLGTPLGSALFMTTAALGAGALSARFGGNLWPTHWPLVAQGILAIVLCDVLEYARHRVSHTHPFFWRFHSLHHSMQDLDILKSGRNHFMDMALRALFVYSPLVLIGIPAEALLFYPVAVNTLGSVAHANLDLRLPRWLHRVVLTPGLHRIHHTSCLESAQSNYANVLPLWDMLFGSYVGVERDTSIDFGIDDDPNPDSFLGQIWTPFTRDFGRSRTGG